MDAETKQQFKDLGAKVDVILIALKGDIKSDQPGLCERVRDVEKTHKNIIRAVWLFGVAVVGQLVIWIRSIITGS